MTKKPNKYRLLASDIKKYLKSKGVYDSIDSTLINELAFNVKLCDDAREDIDDRGIQVDVRKDTTKGGIPYYQVNQSVSVYNGALRMITVISTKLGLTVVDRTKLKLQDEKKDDLLGDLLDS